MTTIGCDLVSERGGGGCASVTKMRACFHRARMINFFVFRAMIPEG
jgi:hypothetical protein